MSTTRNQHGTDANLNHMLPVYDRYKLDTMAHDNAIPLHSAPLQHATKQTSVGRVVVPSGARANMHIAPASVYPHAAEHVQARATKQPRMPLMNTAKTSPKLAAIHTARCITPSKETVIQQS